MSLNTVILPILGLLGLSSVCLGWESKTDPFAKGMLDAKKNPAAVTTNPLAEVHDWTDYGLHYEMNKNGAPDVYRQSFSPFTCNQKECPVIALELYTDDACTEIVGGGAWPVVEYQASNGMPAFKSFKITNMDKDAVFAFATTLEAPEVMANGAYMDLRQMRYAFTNGLCVSPSNLDLSRVNAAFMLRKPEEFEMQYGTTLWAPENVPFIKQTAATPNRNMYGNIGAQPAAKTFRPLFRPIVLMGGATLMVYPKGVKDCKGAGTKLYVTEWSCQPVTFSKLREWGSFKVIRKHPSMNAIMFNDHLDSEDSASWLNTLSCTSPPNFLLDQGPKDGCFASGAGDPQWDAMFKHRFRGFQVINAGPQQ